MNKVIENLKLKVSSTPHIREKNSIEDVMLDVIIALMPVAFASVMLFGQRAFAVILLSVVCCVGFEWLFQLIAHKKRTIKDMSAVVTGMLFAFCMPVNVPYYVVVVGALISIVVTKQLFGGIGQNFMNPALVGRVFVLASFPVALTGFSMHEVHLFDNIADVVTGATPLSKEYIGAVPTITEHLFGTYKNGAIIPGCIGETCGIAILIGFAYLLIRKVISARIPLAFIGTVMVMTLLFGENAVLSIQNPINAVFSGGLLLSAIFMATDYVTSPTTKWGQIIFGIGCGVITCVIRFWGGYPEGVSFAILLMNVLTPLLDKWTVPKSFGKVKA